MAALQYVDVPGYAALLLRKSYTDLSLPGALMDRGRAWLGGTSARWSHDEKTWHFPAGASLTFGYLETDADKYRYQSSEFQFIGLDELTQFPEPSYRYMFSRLRRLAGSMVPLRMRAGSNPGGAGHDWVKQRFITEGRDHGRVFIPARLDDNPYLDRAEYVASLSELDPVTRRQLLAGDWSARSAGGKFQREWFGLVDHSPPGARRVRFWDLAATKPRPGRDPDWTVGVRMAYDRADFIVDDVRRMRGTPQQVQALIAQTAAEDGGEVEIYIEQEPGSSGVFVVDHFVRQLAGYTVRGERTTGDKVTRANPLSSQAEGGHVKVLRRPWLTDYLDELEAFPNGSHDDQVDATSGAFAKLAGTYTFNADDIGVGDQRETWDSIDRYAEALA